MEKKIMLITGARKGIGRYLVEYYIKKGLFVIGCSRGESDFMHDNYKHYCLDIVDEKEVKNLFKALLSNYGRLDFLLNNVGVNYALMPLLLVPYQSALKTLQVNVLGTFLMSREAIKLMKKNTFGRIVNFGSMAVRHEVRGEAIYTASKAAIVSLSRVIAKEVYEYGITCNVVAPSAIKTDLLKVIDKEELTKVLKLNAIPMMGEMIDISNTIDWIIKPESNTITGQVIYMGGV